MLLSPGTYPDPCASCVIRYVVEVSGCQLRGKVQSHGVVLQCCRFFAFGSSQSDEGHRGVLGAPFSPVKEIRTMDDA